MGAVMLAVALATLDTAIANTALPAIATDLHAAPAASVWIINAYQLAMVATLLPLAALGDIIGHRRVFVSGLAVFTLASLACSVAHDKHNIWAVGSSDAAMALAVNTLNELQGGWALVRDGKVLATVSYEIGGLMSCRSPEALDAEMQALYAAAETIEWMYEPTFHPRWFPGFPCCVT